MPLVAFNFKTYIFCDVFMLNILSILNKTKE